MASLAATYKKQGRWKDAKVMMEKQKQLLGEDHSDTLTIDEWQILQLRFQPKQLRVVEIDDNMMMPRGHISCHPVRRDAAVNNLICIDDIESIIQAEESFHRHPKVVVETRHVHHDLSQYLLVANISDCQLDSGSCSRVTFPCPSPRFRPLLDCLDLLASVSRR